MFKRKSDIAYAELRRLILRAELAPGAHLDERALMAELDVGRTPLREAVLRLSQEGLVRGIGGRGYVVSSFTPSDVFHAFELRREVECFAAARAAERRSEAELAEFGAFIARLRDAMLREIDNEAWNLDADEEFHLRIVRASRNRFAEQQVRDLFALSVRTLFVARLPVTRVRDEIAVYERVYEAMRRRDGPAAAHAMGEHLTLNPLQQFFDQPIRPEQVDA